MELGLDLDIKKIGKEIIEENKEKIEKIIEDSLKEKLKALLEKD